MAQLVERTLGKGEVLSSILSISTIIRKPSIWRALSFLKHSFFQLAVVP